MKAHEGTCLDALLAAANELRRAELAAEQAQYGDQFMGQLREVQRWVNQLVKEADGTTR